MKNLNRVEIIERLSYNDITQSIGIIPEGQTGRYFTSSSFHTEEHMTSIMFNKMKTEGLIVYCQRFQGFTLPSNLDESNSYLNDDIDDKRETLDIEKEDALRELKAGGYIKTCYGEWSENCVNELELEYNIFYDEDSEVYFLNKEFSIEFHNEIEVEVEVEEEATRTPHTNPIINTLINCNAIEAYSNYFVSIQANKPLEYIEARKVVLQSLISPSLMTTLQAMATQKNPWENKILINQNGTHHAIKAMRSKLERLIEIHGEDISASLINLHYYGLKPKVKKNDTGVIINIDHDNKLQFFYFKW